MQALCCQRRRLSLASSTVLGGHMASVDPKRRMRGVRGAEHRRQRRRDWVGNGKQVSPPQPTIGAWGERIVSSPPRSPGRAPAKNDFTNF